MKLRNLVIGTFSRKRLIMDLVLVPLAVYVGLIIYAYLVSDRQMFLPQTSSYSEHEQLITITTEDGETLRAMHLTNPDAELTLLYSHGNAEDLGDIRTSMAALRDLGFNVLAYDYRGYGLSTGRPSTRGACLDVEAAYAYLTEDAGIPSETIVAYGRSIGGGPSVYLASRRPVGGLVLQSAFTSAFLVVTKVPLLPFDKFRNLALMSQVSCPVLVMHGTADRVIPLSHGKRLYEAAPEPKRHLWLENTGHNRFPGDHEDAYREALLDFRELVLAEQTGRDSAGQDHEQR